MDRYQFSDEQRKLLEGLSQPIGIFQFLNKRVVTVLLSNGFCDVFGYADRAEAYYDMEHNMYKYTHPDDVARIAEAAFRFATEGGTYEVIYRTRSKYSDEYRIVHAMGKHVYTDDGERLAHIWYTDEGVYGSDIGSQRTELNRAFNSALHEQSLVRESSFDQLTGLPNMTYFFDLAAEAKGLYLEKNEVPVMLYMDLGGMKLFNEHHSYAEGDCLLREYAKTLKDSFGDRNCCRIGADHFAAYTDEESLKNTLEQFFQTCKEINSGNSLPVRVGIFSNSTEDVSASTACDRAKFACDSLRNSYESCYSFYDSSMLEQADLRRHILSNIDRAIEEKWIRVYYHPIIRAMNGRVCDEEALARWFDPTRGILSPADFIPTLESAGIIYKLDLYMLEQALEKMQRTKEIGLHVVPHSINLSRSDFFSCDIVEEVVRRVDAAGISRSKIAIEITESIVGSNFNYMKKQLERFQALGFPVWMDDFGSGYSSISLLQSLSFDLVKFDMDFMRKLDERGDSGKIVLTELIKMATALGADTLCEGVETEQQVRFLQQIGCSKLQGYYYCKPIPIEKIFERYEKGIQIGFEDPDESPYFDVVGRVNLFDLTMMAKGEEDGLQDYLGMLPMGIMEIDGDQIHLVRCNQAYQDFLKQTLDIDLRHERSEHGFEPTGPDASFIRVAQQCSETGGRTFFDNTLPDGSVIRSFVRYIATSPITGKKAVAIALLSVSKPNQGETS